MTTQHFLVTRFNIRHNFDGAVAEFRGLDENWLAPRFKVFQELTVPSVRCQKADFEWIVVIHPDTPDRFQREIDLLSNSGVITVFRTETCDSNQLKAFIEGRLRPNTQWVLTTRLDNDDALARDFLRRVQEAAADHADCTVNVRDGLQLTRGMVFPYQDRSNPFISRKETRETFRTVFDFQTHADIWKETECIQITGWRGWLQSIHEDNVWNTISAPLWRHPMFLYWFQFPVLRRQLQKRGVLGGAEEIVFTAKWAVMQVVRKMLRLGGRVGNLRDAECEPRVKDLIR